MYDIDYEYHKDCPLYTKALIKDYRTRKITRKINDEITGFTFVALVIHHGQVTAVCWKGQIMALRIGVECEDCGIEGMLSYLCMTDTDVMREYERQGSGVSGFEFNEDFPLTDPIQTFINVKRCTKIAFIDFKDARSDIPGRQCPAKQESLDDVSRAALDARYRWTIVIDKMGKAPNEVHASWTLWRTAKTCSQLVLMLVLRGFRSKLTLHGKHHLLKA